MSVTHCAWESRDILDDLRCASEATRDGFCEGHADERDLDALHERLSAAQHDVVGAIILDCCLGILDRPTWAPVVATMPAAHLRMSAAALLAATDRASMIDALRDHTRRPLPAVPALVRIELRDALAALDHYLREREAVRDRAHAGLAAALATINARFQAEHDARGAA